MITGTRRQQIFPSGAEGDTGKHCCHALATTAGLRLQHSKSGRCRSPATGRQTFAVMREGDRIERRSYGSGECSHQSPNLRFDRVWRYRHRSPLASRIGRSREHDRIYRAAHDRNDCSQPHRSARRQTFTDLIAASTGHIPSVRAKRQRSSPPRRNPVKFRTSCPSEILQI